MILLSIIKRYNKTLFITDRKLNNFPVDKFKICAD